MPSQDVRVQLSILDRLLDDAPANGQEAPLTGMQTLRLFKQSVRRDLEWLLNSRCTAEELPEEFEELNRSVYNYGLPDFSTHGLGFMQTRARLVRALRRAIESFEPRIKNVEVNPVDNGEGPVRQMHFVIAGMLDLDPFPEQVVFDTRLELSNGEYKVQEA